MISVQRTHVNECLGPDSSIHDQDHRFDALTKLEGLLEDRSLSCWSIVQRSGSVACSRLEMVVGKIKYLLPISLNLEVYVLVRHS